MMENLKNYTDEQLCEELKRRIEEKRKNARPNKVGDIVDYNGVKLKITLCDSNNTCGNCFFNKGSHCKVPKDMPCTQLLREDNNSVKYVEIK